MVTVKRYIGQFRKPLHWQGWRAFLRRTVWPVLLAAALFLLVRSSLLTHYSVTVAQPGLGLMAGDRILINRTAYGFSLPFQQAFGYPPFFPAAPRIGEIVVYRSADKGSTRLGRIIALPGQADPDTLHSNSVLPPGTYATTSGYTTSENLIGRAWCVSYSVRPDRLFGLRADRFFITLPCAP